MPTLNPSTLKTSPDMLKAGIARGLLAASETDAISRDGGMYDSGVIHDVAIITRGEALGHDLWIDGTFLDQVETSLKSGDGIRARFAHPNLSGDGLARKLGRVTFSRRDGDIVRGDLHFYKASHSTPDGDLANYVMDLASEDPELFGVSIAFQHDKPAENVFRQNHGGYGAFKSPDKDNSHNHQHARLEMLHAADVVDTPASNPDGLFHATSVPHEADSVMAYALGVTDHRPECSDLMGVDPDRLRGFASRFLSSRGLSVTTQHEESAMADTNKSVGADEAQAEIETEDLGKQTTTVTASSTYVETTETEDDEPEQSPESQEETPEGTEATSGDPAVELSARFDRYVSTFGVTNGPEWFKDKVPFEECLSRQVALLSKSNEELKTQLAAALAVNGSDPVTMAPEGDKTPAPMDNQTRFTRAIKIPGRE